MNVSTEGVDVQVWSRMRRPGNAWKWDLKKYCMSWLHGATSKSARREVLHAAESTDNQKIHDGKWQLTERTTHDTTYKTLIKLGRSIVWTSIPLYAPRYPMHRMLAFYNKVQNRKGMKMILNISLALLKSRDHTEPLTLHSLFHPSSHWKHECQSGYYEHNKFLCRI